MTSLEVAASLAVARRRNELLLEWRSRPDRQSHEEEPLPPSGDENRRRRSGSSGGEFRRVCRVDGRELGQRIDRIRRSQDCLIEVLTRESQRGEDHTPNRADCLQQGSREAHPYCM